MAMTDSTQRSVSNRSKLVNAASGFVLVAMIVIAAQVLLGTGMQVYKKVVLASNENYELRTSLSYVATKIKQFDAQGCVDVRRIDQTDVLVLSEEFDGDIYDTLIYFQDKNLCEMMKLREAQTDLSAGFQTMEIDSFKISKEGNAITICAGNASGESDTLKIYLRGKQD